MASKPVRRLLIRAATVDDAEALETLRVTTWRISYPGIVPDTFLDRLEVTQARVERWREGARNTDTSRLVAIVGTELIGFSAAGGTRDEAPDLLTVGEIYAMYVAPPWQRRGVGTELIARSTEVLRNRGYAPAILWTLREGVATRAFYEASGWAFDGTEHTRELDEPVVALVRYARESIVRHEPLALRGGQRRPRGYSAVISAISQSQRVMKMHRCSANGIS